MSLPSALVSCAPKHFSAQPIEMRAALAILTNASEVLHKLLEGNHSKIAGRLAGAFRNIGRDTIADNIIQTMKSAGYNVQERDPFEDISGITFDSHETSPYVNRLLMNWAAMRKPILKHFPPPHRNKLSIKDYLKDLDSIYVTDAYHSLSIEGYQVSSTLIERVRSGSWNPESDQLDRNHRNTLAARGYWLAFQEVRNSVQKLIQKNTSESRAIALADHDKW